MRVSQRSGLFVGLALLVCAAVALEVALTRLYTALLGHHLAFLALSLSLLGAGLGGALLHLVPALARPPALFARLSALAAAASGAAIAAIILLLHASPIDGFAPKSLLLLGAVHLAVSLPFVLTGVIVAASLRYAERDVARLFCIDLAAAAVGGVAGAAALRAGAPRLGLALAIIMALASLCFWLASRAPDATYGAGERRGSGSVVATFLLGSAVLLLGDLGAPWLKLRNLRWTPIDKVELQAWGEHGLITVDRPRSGLAWMRADGTAATPILDPKTAPTQQPDEMAYALHRDQGPVLVLGAGGGRDVRVALKAGQKEVHAVESNPAVVSRVMRGRYAALNGDLFDQPEVHVVVGDGRSYARRSPVQFRHIVVPMVDTWAASSVGALALTESSLHTVEAFRELLDRLTPEGTLLVSRWDGEFDRLLALGAAGLRAVGAARPKDHLFACSASRATSLLVKRTPLARGEIDALRRHCRKGKFGEIFAPDQRSSAAREELVAAAAAPAGQALPTDDRPFFSYAIPLQRLPGALRDLKGLQAENTALLIVATVLVAGAALTIVFLIGGLLGRRSSPAPAPSRARSLLFFVLLGAGFVLVQVAVARPLSALVGRASFALPGVLAALLLSAGAGSLLTARIDALSASRAASIRAQLLVGVATLCALGLGPLLSFGLGLPLVARLALVAAAVVPLGLLMGAQAPLGVKLLASRAPELIPWCWGLSGVAGVAATAAGTLLAMHLGHSAALLAAGLAYLLAAAVVPPPPAPGADFFPGRPLPDETAAPR